MTARIEIRPESLRDTATEIRAAALFFLDQAKEMTELNFSLPSMPPGLESEAWSRIARINDMLSDLAYYYDKDIAALRMSADIIDEDQRRASKVAYVIGILDAAYTAIEEVEKQARKMHTSRAAAARALSQADRIVRIADEIAEELPVRWAGRAVTLAAVMLDFMEYWEDSGHNLKETARRTAITTGSGFLGGGLGRLLCTGIPNPWIKGGCVLVGAIAGATLGDSAGDPDNWKDDPKEARRAATPSGLLPSDIRERREDHLAGLMAARSAYVDELMADGVPREEAEHLAELNYPDYFDAQLSP